MVDPGYFGELLFRTIGVFAEQFQFIHADGKRGLQLVGSILYKLFLLVIHFRTPVGCRLDGLVQYFELFHLGLVYQWSLLFSGPVFFQPFHQRVKGAEAGLEYEMRYQQDTAQKAYI